MPGLPGDESGSGNGGNDHDKTQRLPEHDPAKVLDEPEHNMQILDLAIPQRYLVEFLFCFHVVKIGNAYLQYWFCGFDIPTKGGISAIHELPIWIQNINQLLLFFSTPSLNFPFTPDSNTHVLIVLVIDQKKTSIPGSKGLCSKKCTSVPSKPLLEITGYTDV